MMRRVSCIECAGALEWSFDITSHIWVGKMSVRDAAHCPSCRRIQSAFEQDDWGYFGDACLYERRPGPLHGLDEESVPP